MTPMLTPALALVTWTLIMGLWMYATRIPAMRKAGIDPAKMKEKSEMDALPKSVRQIADNYNHLHEQPVIFYALVFYAHLADNVGALTIGLAWAYVALRVAHSLYQALINFIPVRFMIFIVSNLVLIILALVNLFALGN